MTRTPEEVYEAHKAAILNRDFDALAADYAEDALLITIDGSFKGKAEIMTGFFQAVFSQFPDVEVAFEKTSFEGDVCLLQWSAESASVTIPRGTAAFIIQDGLIQRQAEWFQIIPKEG